MEIFPIGKERNSGAPRGSSNLPPEIPKAIQNRAKLNLIMKNVKK